MMLDEAKIDRRVRIVRDDAPDLRVAICTASSDHGWQAAFERLGRCDPLLIPKKPLDPVEARRIAKSMTHESSVVEYARRQCEPPDESG